MYTTLCISEMAMTMDHSFRGTWNFEPSSGISTFLCNFAELGTGQW